MAKTVAEAQAAVTAAEEAVRVAQVALHNARRELAAARTRAAEEAKRAARRRTDNARNTARRKAAKLGVEIERENFSEGPLYWVWPPAGRYPIEEKDPLCGEHSCVGWDEVLEKVEEYERAFAKEDAHA